MNTQSFKTCGSAYLEQADLSLSCEAPSIIVENTLFLLKIYTPGFFSAERCIA
jgi:hypothetical protein